MMNNNFTNNDIHRCLTSNYYPSTDRCFNLRRLDIRIKYTCFLENLIEHVPNLEQLSIQFKFSLKFDILWKTNFEILEQSNENWLNKIPKLRYFSLKTSIDNTEEFIYLKWLLHNFNYVEKLEIHLYNYNIHKTESDNI
ncbi:unnamed protein product [Rotaria sp. Silwood2]|nr:unnamed protein product [Rotaria sp. Silwood2]